jgi:phosphatidylglycerol lysyltransferase
MDVTTWGSRIWTLLPLVALAACGWLVWQHSAAYDPREVLHALMALPAGQLGLAGCLTCLSFLAVGRFELAARDLLGLEGPRRAAARAGMAAVAIAQTAGFGAITGGLARVRALPDLGLGPAAALSVAVSVVFMAALSFWAVAAWLIAMQGQTALLIALLALGAAMLARLAPLPRMPGLSPLSGCRLAGWTLIDVVAGAAVLAVLLPAAGWPGPVIFGAAYLAALLAGFLSQSPGGFGAFELTMIALLPGVDPAALVAALISYRVIYHLLPALVALGWLMTRRAAEPSPDLRLATGAARERALARAPHGDWALARDGAALWLTRTQDQGWLLSRTGHLLVAIGRPLGRAEVGQVCDLARSRGLTPVLYKADARTAARARQAGWTVIRIAREAVLSPAHWSPDQPACRSLRRKLRAADKAGLRIHRHDGPPPWGALAAISAEWCRRQGGEHGFSMGRLSPDLLRHAVILIASLDGKPVGFVTLNRARDMLALDLMRTADGAPDGTMQALVAAAITFARDEGMTDLSLAAVPSPPGWLLTCLPAAGRDRLTRPGLCQFKSGFAPAWRPLYLAVPRHWQALPALVAVGWAVHHPADRSGRTPHDHDAEKRFDLPHGSCDFAHDPPRPHLIGRGPATEGQPSNDPSPDTDHPPDERPVRLA